MHLFQTRKENDLHETPPPKHFFLSPFLHLPVAAFGGRTHKTKIIATGGRLFFDFNFSMERNNSATLKFSATFLRRAWNYGTKLHFAFEIFIFKLVAVEANLWKPANFLVFRSNTGYIPRYSAPTRRKIKKKNCRTQFQFEERLKSFCTLNCEKI